MLHRWIKQRTLHFLARCRHASSHVHWVHCMCVFYQLMSKWKINNLNAQTTSPRIILERRYAWRFVTRFFFVLLLLLLFCCCCRCRSSFRLLVNLLLSYIHRWHCQHNIHQCSYGWSIIWMARRCQKELRYQESDFPIWHRRTSCSG